MKTKKRKAAKKDSYDFDEESEEEAAIGKMTRSSPLKKKSPSPKPTLASGRTRSKAPARYRSESPEPTPKKTAEKKTKSAKKSVEKPTVGSKRKLEKKISQPVKKKKNKKLSESESDYEEEEDGPPMKKGKVNKKLQKKSSKSKEDLSDVELEPVKPAKKKTSAGKTITSPASKVKNKPVKKKSPPKLKKKTPAASKKVKKRSTGDEPGVGSGEEAELDLPPAEPIAVEQADDSEVFSMFARAAQMKRKIQPIKLSIAKEALRPAPDLLAAEEIAESVLVGLRLLFVLILKKPSFECQEWT